MTVLTEESSIVLDCSNSEHVGPSVRGTIVNVEEDQVIACLDSPVELSPGDPLSIGYTDPGTSRFVKAPGRVQVLLGLDPKPIYQLLITGPFDYADRRHWPRVKFDHQRVRVRLGTDRDCTLRDIGGGGLGVLSRSDLPLNSTLPIGIEYLGHRCSGIGRVRHILRIDEETRLYGVEVGANETSFRNWLGRACSLLTICGRTVRCPLDDSALRMLFDRDHSVISSWRDRDLECSAVNSMWINARLSAEFLLKGPLAGTIYDENGSLLFVKGSALTPEDLHELSNRNVILGSDWFPDSSPGEQKGVDVRRDLDRRLFSRSPWHVTGVCKILDPRDSRSFSITTIDISPGGMGFESDSYVEYGTRVEVQLEINGSSSRARGQIASCRIVENSANPFRYRIGVQFTESVLECNSPFPHPRVS